ncbi:MORC family CW-type zinc finger protein 3a isoform X2 [Cottoperca gobio]|nr:MORC family CW-type zinc finger protein 3 isoform X2 [Cottoperca gobio]XP_029315455.1 MORC family CW-type zinc finger protein 3 isoform X2 [Cottoperca gobio]
MMAAQTDRGVPLSTLCPKYLHTNSTSHTWPFSAIAELIDNAYDPDVSAKHFWIDKTVVKKQECLSFMDNGNGLDNETMHKMLSFGYSDKTTIKGVKPIGMYGNGFKSGSMCLGRDAIVFSKSKSVSCVGMLSQTYLEKIGANQISVPIVCFKRTQNEFGVREEQKASLQDILLYSPFKTQEELLREIESISSHGSTTGTRIIIWNLRSTSTRKTEFDFETDRYDIRIPSDVYETMKDTSQQPDRVTSHNPESFYSLRAYCSILYLKPRMQIIIRGNNVKSQLIAKSLAFVRKDHYKPTFLMSKRIPITFGYNTKSKDQYGIMMYHKNRLIKAYEHVGCQLKANNKGVGVIGVIECYFLEPTHNKQSFMETDKYRKTMTNLGTKLEDYWNEIKFKRKKENPNSTIPVEDIKKRPDQNWVQCEECLRWRKLPDGIDCTKLPEKWFCHLNPDPQFRSCQVEQESVDSDDEQPSYIKTYKLQQREEKNIQEERQKVEETRMQQEVQRLANLSKKKQAKGPLQSVASPSTPTTPRSRFNTVSPRGGAARAASSPLRTSTLSQAACSPSSSDALPIIYSVCSLSEGPLRGKRTRPASPQVTPKRPKVNGFQRGKLDTSNLIDVRPLSSPSVLDDNKEDDTDDDIFIMEIVSSPKPKTSRFDPTKVKTEGEQSDANVGMQLECSDDAAVDDASEMNVGGTGSGAVGASRSRARPSEVTTSTTQTEVSKVKNEEEDHIQNEGEERAGQSTSNQSGRAQTTDVAVSVCNVEQSVNKSESSGAAHRENQGKQTLQNGVTRHLDSDEDAGPSCVGNDPPLYYPGVIEAQEQQDQLLELMKDTAQERDSFKEQVRSLTCQLQDLQSRLQELSPIKVKKEGSDQASQTEETEGGKDYKDLFEKAKQKVDELIKDKEVSLAAAENKPSTSQCKEKEMDEIALQVDYLMRELDQRNNERDELQSQLTSLEEEKANLASQCDELRLSQQQQRENAQERSTTPHGATGSTEGDPQEEGATASSSTDSSSDTSKCLIELRHNIGRLLLSYVPALDLDQVNYECNVIDEILDQVLSNGEFVAPVELRDGATNE